MKKQNLIGCIFLVIVLAGCATVPDAALEKSTMLVGEVYFTGKNLSGTPYLNSGVFRNGIAVTIIDNNGKEYVVKTDRAGIFCLANIQEGSYALAKLLIQSDRGGWVSVTLNPQGVVDVIGNKVNNVGRIEWHRDDRISTFTYGIIYEPVKSDFNKRYKKSNWNDIPWIDVSVKK